MGNMIKGDLLYFFGLAMLISWLTLFLLLRQVNIQNPDETKIAEFWQTSPLIQIFLIFTGTFVNNYADFFMRSRGVKTVMYGLASLIIGSIVLGTLYLNFLHAFSSGDGITILNFVVLSLITGISLAFSVIYSRKISRQMRVITDTEDAAP